ncbi:E3 ubiquitin-protein ligase RNF220 [Takifugu flavidus]|uniref:E3 ubiquitin-protein ligase RNF220 n=1 Tax=Takifugu flavidus TaxID=433684 RepID=A0A5C6NZM9_9TELE|nr:E3 ubiquitin-protein ligase RNF220 [Takifugu flavidus]
MVGGGLMSWDSYTMPLTSIQCWHVHCEECWLRTLTVKRPDSCVLAYSSAYFNRSIGESNLTVVLPPSQGNKKLCPQCNTITSPGDLRRVYL